MNKRFIKPVCKFGRQFTVVTLFLVSTTIINSNAMSQSDDGYSNYSIRGAYAVSGVNTGDRGTTGAIGMFLFDGKGNVKAVVDLNRPDGKGGRNLIETRVNDGRYDVQKDGRGKFTNLSRSINVDDIFIVSKSDGRGTAIELFVVFGDIGPRSTTGALRSFRLTRVNAGNKGFSRASLRGSFTVGEVNVGPNGATGVVGLYHFDGKGNVKASLDHNQSNGKGGRKLIEIPVPAGKYWLGSGGRGVFANASDSRSNKDIFVVTATDNKGMATELFAILGDQGRGTGALRTFTLTRQRP